MNLTTLGNVTYTYHHHSSGCIATCGGKFVEAGGAGSDVNGNEWTWYRCQKCGYTGKTMTAYISSVLSQTCTQSSYVCGYTEGAIETAIITY